MMRNARAPSVERTAVTTCELVEELLDKLSEDCPLPVEEGSDIDIEVEGNCGGDDVE